MSENIEIKEVPLSDKRLLKEFIKLPWTVKIYKNDPAWVPPVISDQKKFFDPSHGYFWEHGEAALFLAYKNNKPVGRITAHRYSRYEDLHDSDTGFFGFYESIDDIDVSNKLFEAAAEWLRTKGKKKMVGPYSFTTYDHIGIDVEGNEKMPVIGLFHSAPYYENHLTHIGLQKKVDWHCFMVQGHGDHSSYLTKVKEEIMTRHIKELGLEYFTTTKKEINRRAEQVKNIFNIAWEGNEDHMPFTEKHFDSMFEELQMLIVPELAIFAEKDGKTIGFIFSIPDANPGLAKLNGRLYPWRIVRLLWEVKKAKTLRTILMGVLPEYRGQGIDDVLILMTIENGLKKGFLQSDCSLIAETNKKMIGSIKYLNADRYKSYRVFQKDI